MASTDVTEALLGSGVVCEEASLLHNTIYSSTLYITNAAVTSLTTTLSTNGIYSVSRVSTLNLSSISV